MEDKLRIAEEALSSISKIRITETNRHALLPHRLAAEDKVASLKLTILLNKN